MQRMFQKKMRMKKKRWAHTSMNESKISVNVSMFFNTILFLILF